MAQPRIPFETPSYNPNWVYGDNSTSTSTRPGGRDLVSRPNHIFGGGAAPTSGPAVTDAEFRNAKPIGPTTIKDISSPYGKYGEAATKAGAKVGAALDKAGSAVRTVANTPGVQLAGRVLSAADMAHQGLRSIDSFENGDNVTGGYHGARAAIALGAGMGNPLAMAAGGGLAAGDLLYNYGLSDDTKGSIGSGVNKLVRGAGRMVGQDWGVDPVQGDAAVFGGPGPQTVPAKSMPAAVQNPLRMQEQSAGIVNPGAAPTQLPELRLGKASPAGTFGDGYTDMGGGIAGKGSGLRGQANDFTNIGANGQATAMSQIDPRTPDQIANGERIKAQTAATVAAAGGLGNLQRQNAMMAANIRDGVDPHQGFNGPTASIINTGLRGNMRVNDQNDGGRNGDSVVEMARNLRSAGIKVSHNTLRQIMQNDAQMKTNAASNATQVKTNAASNAAQLAANANSVDAQREGNYLTESTNRRGQDITHQGHILSNQSSRQRLLYDIGKDQRDYTDTRSDKAIEQARAAREEALKYVDRYIPVDPKTGKVDEATKGQFLQFASNYVGNTIGKLRQSNDANDRALADRLAKQDIASFDAKTWSTIKSLWDMRNTVGKTSGVMYGSSSSNGSMNPADWVPSSVDNTGVTPRVNMPAGQIAASRLRNPDGELFSFFGQGTNAYADALEEARRQNPNWNGAQR